MLTRLNHKSLTLAVATIVINLLARHAIALDYFIDPVFNSPIGEESPYEWPFGDFVTYHANTGEVVYQVGALRQGVGWWPPDLVSKSGKFLPEIPLQAVPLASLEQPIFRTDEIIGGELVRASNGIHVEYDGYRFWPFAPSEPWILAQWNLETLPQSYSFGKVLPLRLSESFLLSDLYSFPRVNLVYVIPEPPSLQNVGIAVIVVASTFQIRKRNERFSTRTTCIMNP